MIGFAANVCTKIKRIDFSKPTVEIRKQISVVRSSYLRQAHVVGFPWWVMWIPAAVCLGFDVVMQPNCLWPSLIAGCLGWFLFVLLHFQVNKSTSDRAIALRRQLSGHSISSALAALDQIEDANIL
jgi:serine/threonine-protein kinase